MVPRNNSRARPFWIRCAPPGPSPSSNAGPRSRYAAAVGAPSARAEIPPDWALTAATCRRWRPTWFLPVCGSGSSGRRRPADIGGAGASPSQRPQRARQAAEAFGSATFAVVLDGARDPIRKRGCSAGEWAAVGSGETALDGLVCKLRGQYEIAAITNDISTGRTCRFLTKSGALPPRADPRRRNRRLPLDARGRLNQPRRRRRAQPPVPASRSAVDQGVRRRQPRGDPFPSSPI